MEKDVLYKIVENLKLILQTSLTNTKPYAITDTATHTFDKAHTIQCIDACEFDVLLTETKGSLQTIPMVKGEIWYGVKPKEIKLSKGAVIVYSN
jgi:hypothetical protein